MDAPAVALDLQLRQLSVALDRLGVARRDLVPASATFWGGAAREQYDRALVEVESQLGTAVDALLSARRGTLIAFAELGGA